ncbi:TetR/AcrR family transcriptional regulator [Herbiconiux sp. 11R-BC]|uniref:TetR/AcrR family transcriptional regulator n=1 Tax=Herbiconiux sp. 11R-BC TaxID=3111637 RepID=UPI003C080D75
MGTTSTAAAGSYHHGNLRSALLERAEQTLELDGVEGLSLRQLARDLGVSHGAPGRHFRDKQALLDELAYDGFVAMNARLEVAAHAVGTLRERLDAVARAYVAFAVEHRTLLSVMYTTKHAPDASERLRLISHASMDTTTGLLRQGQAEGVLSAGDPERLALVAFAAVHGVATLASNALLDGVPVEAATSATVAVLWAGMTAPPATT